MAIYALGDLAPTIDPTAYVHPDAVLIGDVRVGAEASIWPGAVLRGDGAPITVGARTSIQDGSVLHVTPVHPTTVGAECVVGHLVHMEGCTIEDGSLVGSGAVVLHGAVVRTEALVGAGAVVSGGVEVPSRAMALGVPARIRPDAVDPDEMIRVAVRSYVERGATYRRELRRLG
ncbi:MAG TPA: gamma carbonic anhydrase family protein [Acidimicrobiales bacterium]|nr:gamma carbonic anhydrase family protein [Acidimicrobiales bacterium]